MLDTKVFLSAIDELENNVGVSREITIQALKEAFESIFKKKGYEDSRVEVEIKPEEGEISIYVIKKIVDEVLDDALEIELEDAKEIDPEAKVGEDCRIKSSIDDFSKADASKLKSILKQKIKEAEKAAIYSAYSDKAGELITGVVEKVEPKFTIINIGKTSVTLPDNHKIGDESFTVGQTIKVYLSQVNSLTSGPVIHVSRADSGFLKRLFEEEIPEIFDGTVVIKGVARKAGERSKVSVYSKDPTVDPIGACIGQGGSKIQKICAQLGKEKIDIVQYHDYPGSFIAEALKPAQVIGVKLNEENNSAVAIVKNDDLRVAIGKRGINAVLAVELTKWKIDIKELDDAMAEGIEYEAVELMTAKDNALKAARQKEEMMAQFAEEQAKAEEVKAEEAVTESPVSEEVKTSAPVSEDAPANETPVNEEVKVSEPVSEPVKEEEKQAEEEKVEYNPVRMQPKFSLSDLEKQIEDEKKKKSQPEKKKYFKKDKDEEENKTATPKTDTSSYMPIYNDDEEDEDFEEEEKDYDDNRFDEYDDDSFYEDK